MPEKSPSLQTEGCNGADLSFEMRVPGPLAPERIPIKWFYSTHFIMLSHLDTQRPLHSWFTKAQLILELVANFGSFHDGSF